MLLLLAPLGIYAQTTVVGEIVEEASGIPLPGVNVVIKGTAKGVVTDYDGKYTIENVKEGAILTFTYIGFLTQEIPFTGKKTINVTLKEDVSELSEVILIGYGSSSKEDVTGSVQAVSAKDFNKGAIVSPEQLFTGKTAGVRVLSAGGAPGAGSQIRIRAGSSLSGNSTPLIVIDGVPLDQGDLQGARNPLNIINPDEIKDFVILKDAAATAIYGSRASNGVILITTKKGSRNAPLSVELDTKYSLSEITNQTDIFDANGFRNLVNERATDKVNLLGNANTNWQNLIYHTAPGAITNLTLSKGFKNSALRVNFNATDQSGVVRTDTYKRHAVNLSYTQFLLNDDLKLTLSSKNSISKNRFANNDAILAATQFDPTQPIFDEQGRFFEFREGNTFEVNAPSNPLGLLIEDVNKATNLRTVTSLSADYKIPFVNGLRFNLNAALDYTDVDGEQNKPASVGQNKDDVPFRKVFGGFNRNQLVDFYFNYKKDIDFLKSKIDVTAGYSYQEFFEAKNRSETQTGVFGPVAPERARDVLIGYFGRASIDFNNKYLISGSIRRDLSSKFSEDNRVGIFPAASIAWKIHNEKFLEDSNVISELKLRGGAGVTGQQEIGLNLGFIGLLRPGEGGAQVQFGDEFVDTLRFEPKDDNLKWEETLNYNVGLDFGLFSNRISGSIEYYQKNTKDLLVEVQQSAGTNTTDVFFNNAGETKSSGVEFQINGDVIQKKDFNWNLGFNLTYNEREIDRLSLIDDPNVFRLQGGISGGTGNTIQIWKPGFDPTTFFVNRQVYDANGVPIEGAFVDVNGDGELTDSDKVPYKKATPDIFGGLTSNMRYKNFDFNFTFRGAYGGYNYNNVQSNTGNEAFGLNPPGDFLRNVNTDILNTNFRNAQFFSDYYVQKADFVRLDNISAGYNLPFKNIKMRLSFTVTNVFTITNYEGLDPELFVTDVGSQREGIDDKFYPRPRTFVLGLNVKF